MLSVLGLFGSGLGIGLGLSVDSSRSTTPSRPPHPLRPAASTPSSVPSTAPTTSTNTAGVSSVALPSSYVFDQISVVNGNMLLLGELASTSSSTTPACVSATVDPHTLQVGSANTFNCDDPALLGDTVGVVDGNVSDSNNATVSISDADPATGQVSVGPVVMTYSYGSTSRPVFASGGSWLWIYDNSVIPASEAVNASNSGVAELLQVSTSTGLVVDSVPMPMLAKPLMAANDEGLWLGDSIDGGESPGALYFVAPGSSGPETMLSGSSTVVCWITGSQDVLWLGVNATVASGCQGETLMRLDGTDPQPAFQVPFQLPDEGYERITVIGDEAQGLWTVQGGSVVSIDPDNGSQRVVTALPPATVQVSDDGLNSGNAMIFGGSMYLLEAPFVQEGGYLVRVQLPR